MNILLSIVLVYLIIGVVYAIWLFYRTNEPSRSASWVECVALLVVYLMAVLFWPFFFIKKFHHNLSHKMLIRSMKRCGHKIKYKDRNGHGLFEFLSSDCERVLSDIHEVNKIRYDDELLEWFRRRDDNSDRIVELKVDFTDSAMAIIKEGRFRVRCDGCGWDGTTVIEDEDKPRPHGGWIYKTYICPNKHELISAKIMHISLSEPDLI